MVDRYVIATIKSWNIENAKKLAERYDDSECVLVTDKDSLTREWLDEIAPRYVFFPHWSWMIPREIYSAYECVVFHMAEGFELLREVVRKRDGE